MNLNWHLFLLPLYTSLQKTGFYVVQIGLICYMAKNDPELSSHPKLLANYDKDAESGYVKATSWS